MEHKTEYPADLAEELGNLRYDTLTRFLTELAEKIKKDSEADAGRKRYKLAQALDQASWSLHAAATEIAEAWMISKPFMK